jgi:predicted component of type VI protein secretion system
VKEAIWDAVRAMAIKAITLPVSWIGRVHFTRDSKIADITVDPASFEAGQTTPTAGGREQVSRVIEFLQRMPDSRMVLTPVITVGDLDVLRQQEARSMIEKAAQERAPSSPASTPNAPTALNSEAAARVFAARFPGRQAPASVEAIVAAVAADLEPPESAAHKLAKDRLAAVRSTLKDAGIDLERVQVNKDTEGLEAPEGGRVEFGLTDTLKPKRHLLAELLHKLKTLLASRRA